MFKVNELLKATRGRLIKGNKNTIVKSISIDSRTIRREEAFIAIKGANFDGHNFVDEAIEKGAKAVIVQSSKFIVHSSKKYLLLQLMILQRHWEILQDTSAKNLISQL